MTTTEQPTTDAPTDTVPADPAPTGGCLCGRIRYRLATVPTDVGHCHCRLCQRSAGAPVVTWATVPRAELTITEGTPRWFRSSSLARRGFCPICGTQLFFAYDPDENLGQPPEGEPVAMLPAAPLDEIDVTIASLDEPDRCAPTRNGWVGSRRAFMHGFDADLPDFDGEPPPA